MERFKKLPRSECKLIFSLISPSLCSFRLAHIHRRGVTPNELRHSVKEKASKSVPLPEARELRARIHSDGQAGGNETKTWLKGERKDNSPVRVSHAWHSRAERGLIAAKPLADFMDIRRIFQTPHTAEQISSLWTAFHASRSSGTGRGYLSASVPVSIYETIVHTAKTNPSFIIPLMRESQIGASAEDPAAEPAYEFFFMQWIFHAPSPSPSSGPLDDPLPSDIRTSDLPLATVLFTPLLEYKTRSTFATPHLVLTLYPDFSASHGVVLLRGELTPSPGENGRYLLSQQEAQLLALGMQRFYLADNNAQDEKKDQNAKKRAELLRTFNSQPTEFRWEDLLKHADPTS